MLPPLRVVLDPREHPDPPSEGAVWIPFSELPHRLAELPPKGEALRVIAHPAAEAFLRAGGRELMVIEVEPATRLSEGRLWRPNPWLEANVPRVRTATDLGCGAGREAVFLAAQGLQVTAYDHLPDARAQTEALAARFGVSLQVRNLDFDQEDPAPADLVWIGRALPLDWLARAPRWVEPGGYLILATFSTEYQAKTGHPRDSRRALGNEVPDGFELEIENTTPEERQVVFRRLS